MKRNILRTSIGILILVTLLSGCFRSRGGSTGPVDLSFYGLDDSDVFESLISQYREQHSNVRIRYKKFNNASEFQNLLVNEIAEGEGPDVFYVHNTWMARHLKKTVPLQSDEFTAKNFDETFVTAASEAFIQPAPADGTKKIYALPLFVDTLALYYNKDDFEKRLPERGKPAETWDQIKEDAAKFREEAEDGKLTHGEIAMGRSDNMNFAADVLYHLWLQAGVDFYDEEFKQLQITSGGADSFEYFMSFALPAQKNYSWSTDLVAADKPLHEVEAFLSGKVSAILGYSDLYPRFENDLKNVKTRNDDAIAMSDIGVAKSPQITTDETEQHVWASSYGLTVSRNSKNPTEAWKFIQFLTSKEKSRFYHQKTKRPTARRDLIEEQKKEPITEVFASQLGYASSVPLFDAEMFRGVLYMAITEAASGRSAKEALSEAQTKINEAMKIQAPEGMYPKPKKK